MFGREGVLLSLGSGVVEVSGAFGEVMMEAMGLEGAEEGVGIDPIPKLATLPSGLVCVSNHR